MLSNLLGIKAMHVGESNDVIGPKCLLNINECFNVIYIYTPIIFYIDGYSTLSLAIHWLLLALSLTWFFQIPRIITMFIVSGTLPSCFLLLFCYQYRRMRTRMNFGGDISLTKTLTLRSYEVFLAWYIVRVMDLDKSE